MEVFSRVNQFNHRYVDFLLNSFLPPIIVHGFSFEAHLQNVLARFKFIDRNWKLVGFIIRDFGGIKVHRDTLFNSTGKKLKVWNEEACILAKNLEEVKILNIRFIL